MELPRGSGRCRIVSGCQAIRTSETLLCPAEDRLDRRKEVKHLPSSPRCKRPHISASFRCSKNTVRKGKSLKMALQAFLCLILASSTTAHRGPRVPRDLRDELFVSRLATEKPAESLSQLSITDHVLNLQRGNGSSLSSLYVNTIRAQAAGENPYHSRLNQVFRMGTQGGTQFLTLGDNNSPALLKCLPSPEEAFSLPP